MKKVYIKYDGDGQSILEDPDGVRVEVSRATISAATRGTVTDELRHAVRAALGEEVRIEDGWAEFV